MILFFLFFLSFFVFKIIILIIIITTIFFLVGMAYEYTYIYIFSYSDKLIIDNVHEVYLYDDDDDDPIVFPSVTAWMAVATYCKFLSFNPATLIRPSRIKYIAYSAVNVSHISGDKPE